MMEIPMTPPNRVERSTASIRDTIQIRGQAVPCQHVEIEQSRLRFYTENPRIYSAVRAKSANASQAQIQETLCATDHVRQLARAIKRDGGLTDPVIVNGATMEVLEGNCRLAAYRLLAQTDIITWAKLRCIVLPADVTEDIVFALLGQYHINGKLPWQPFEQAGFLHRRSVIHKNDIDALAAEVGVSAKAASHLVATYGFMLKHDNDRNHWSFYDEYFKSRDIRAARQRYPELDDRFVNSVRTDKRLKAIDVRAKLAKICKQEKILKRYVNATLELPEAYERFVESGADTSGYQKFSRFRDWLATDEARKELMGYTGADRQKTLLEIKKLEMLVVRLRRNLSDENAADTNRKRRKG